MATGTGAKADPGAVPSVGLSDTTTRAAAQSSTMEATRASGSVTARGTKTAPTHKEARAATTKSTELGSRRATRSPAVTPASAIPLANRAASAHRAA